MIVGLGNPGPRYAASRHNLGFMVLERLAAKAGARLRQGICSSAAGRVRVAGRDVVLARPLTYMNNSGPAVRCLLAHFKVHPGELVVVHDDLDLPPGTLRIRPGGGSGGHRGLDSIMTTLGTRDFGRLRVGVGRPPADMEPSEFVLQPLHSEEQDVVADWVAGAARALEVLVGDGFEPAMNEFNRPATAPDC